MKISARIALLATVMAIAGLSTVPLASAATTSSAQQFTKDMNTVNAAVHTWETAMSRFAKRPNFSTLKAKTQPVVTAFQTLQRTIGSQRWPSSAKRPMAAFSASLTPLIGDFKKVKSLNVGNVQAWMTAIGRHLSAFVSKGTAAALALS